MNNKTKEHIEDLYREKTQLYSVLESMNKYIYSLEKALKQKPRVETKIIMDKDEVYRTNSVKLFKQYNREIEELKQQLALKDKEIDCLKAVYIKADGEYRV